MPANAGRASAKHFRKATLRRSIQYPSPPYESSHAQKPSPAPRTHPAGLGANYQISQKKAKSPFHGSSCLLSPECSSVPQPLSQPATANPTDSLSPDRHLVLCQHSPLAPPSPSRQSKLVNRQSHPPAGRPASSRLQGNKVKTNKQTNNTASQTHPLPPQKKTNQKKKPPTKEAGREKKEK